MGLRSLTLEARLPKTDDIVRLLKGVEATAATTAQSELFYRQFAQFLAREAAADFRKNRGPASIDAAGVVSEFLRHEQEGGRLKQGEIVAAGRGFRFGAEVHDCPYVANCKRNMGHLGEVPQCVRAVTLIEAVNARIPERPPLSYDISPGLVDGTGPTCSIRVRPAGVPDYESVKL